MVHFMRHASFGDASKMGEAGLHKHHKLLAAAQVAAAAQAAGEAASEASRSACDSAPAAGDGPQQQQATQQYTQPRQEQQKFGQSEQRVPAHVLPVETLGM